MSHWWLAFDLGLIGAIIGTAHAALSSRDGSRMVALFMGFGFLVAIAWARLKAPDVALAEAAIGSGITGALLYVTLQRVGLASDVEGDDGTRPPWRLVSAGVAVLLTVGLGGALVAISRPAPSLADAVAARMSESGVTNPVTAVLLNFRGYDTLLEVVVLLIAVVSIWSVRRSLQQRTMALQGELFLALLRLVTPVLVLLAGYLLWLGSFAPGGAFPAAALLAAASILWMLAGVHPPVRDGPKLRAMLASGAAIFALAAALAAALGGELLQYPTAQAKHWILAIEAALTLSIAAMLVALFHSGAPATHEPAERDEQ